MGPGFFGDLISSLVEDMAVTSFTFHLRKPYSDEDAFSTESACTAYMGRKNLEPWQCLWLIQDRLNLLKTVLHPLFLQFWHCKEFLEAESQQTASVNVAGRCGLACLCAALSRPFPFTLGFFGPLVCSKCTTAHDHAV
jgi:hypothetical protein